MFGILLLLKFYAIFIEMIISKLLDGSWRILMFFLLFYLHFIFLGQNVVGMKDKDISKIIEENDQVVTVTVIPNFLYRHMMKK